VGFSRQFIIRCPKIDNVSSSFPLVVCVIFLLLPTSPSFLTGSKQEEDKVTTILESSATQVTTILKKVVRSRKEINE
jgi:hypothetical protein